MLTFDRKTIFLCPQIERPLSDESISSNLSEVRRGTLYKRPGPPTPSKNGGRLSFGPLDVPPRDDVLKESNNNINRASSSEPIANKKTATPSGGGGRPFLSMFSSKGRDEVCVVDFVLSVI